MLPPYKTLVIKKTIPNESEPVDVQQASSSAAGAIVASSQNNHGCQRRKEVLYKRIIAAKTARDRLKYERKDACHFFGNFLLEQWRALFVQRGKLGT